MTRKKQRLVLITVAMVIIGSAVALTLFALGDKISYFLSPKEYLQKSLAPGTRLRIGGLVKSGSLKKGVDQKVDFMITDNSADIDVDYQGQLPDLFHEGQGVIVEGTVADKLHFHADTVLAKHDEKYMPREIVDVLKKNGTWQGKENAP